MTAPPDATKLAKLHKLDSLLPREIRGQSHALPRIISAVQRGELGLTKPSRPRGSFLLLGPTGVGKTETVVVTTNWIFSAGQLFRFDMSEFQNQEALGLLLGARLGKVGYLGAVRWKSWSAMPCRNACCKAAQPVARSPWTICAIALRYGEVKRAPSEASNSRIKRTKLFVRSLRI